MHNAKADWIMSKKVETFQETFKKIDKNFNGLKIFKFFFCLLCDLNPLKKMALNVKICIRNYSQLNCQITSKLILAQLSRYYQFPHFMQAHKQHLQCLIKFHRLSILC